MIDLKNIALEEKVNLEDIKIFQHEIFKNVPVKEQLQHLGAAAYIMATALKCKNKKDAKELLHLVDGIYSPWNSDIYEELFSSVYCEVLEKFKRDEYYYMQLLRDSLEDAKLIEIQTGEKTKMCVTYNGILTPVELTMNNFNSNAKKRLVRFMNDCDCKKGIAIGRKLKVKLPSNIMFMSLDELEVLNNEQ